MEVKRGGGEREIEDISGRKNVPTKNGVHCITDTQ